ncbi:type 4a pilus biogenesis protein PilN [Maricurvus nonylphenolicus]|uniref:PilN domain-containing protein n=1 Tax=Maricurvus nonylphenolicus TaxID=1008307 RepID=UPI0036F2C0E1
MANINLLPWRDEYRKEKQQEFLTIIVGVAILAALVSYIWVSAVDGMIANQNSRNQMLQIEIQALEKRVVEIQELKKRRTELLERMKVIQGLQGKRPLIVRYFDELVRSVPEGVHLTALDRKGSQVSVQGITESNVRVSAFMRNLDESTWFTSPNLSSVKAEPDYGEQASSFRLTFTTAVPAENDEQGG